MSIELKFKRLHKNAVLPTYAHHGDSGMDIRTVEMNIIPAMSFMTVDTGIAAVIPPGYELQVRPRSGLMSNQGVYAGFGTVDEGYRGEIRVTMFNSSKETCIIDAGSKVAQLVLSPVARAQISETLDISTDTERGTDGFGSTGM